MMSVMSVSFQKFKYNMRTEHMCTCNIAFSSIVRSHIVKDVDQDDGDGRT